VRRVSALFSSVALQQRIDGAGFVEVFCILLLEDCFSVYSLIQIRPILYPYILSAHRWNNLIFSIKWLLHEKELYHIRWCKDRIPRKGSNPGPKMSRNMHRCAKQSEGQSERPASPRYHTHDRCNIVTNVFLVDEMITNDFGDSKSIYFENRLIDWCFYYFVRNSLVVLLEVLCARIFSFRFVNMVSPWHLLSNFVPCSDTHVWRQFYKISVWDYKIFDSVIVKRWCGSWRTY